MLISTVVLCVPLLYLVDRVFSVIYKESMDQRPNDSPPTSLPSPAATGFTVCHHLESLTAARTEVAPKKDDQPEVHHSIVTEVVQAKVTSADKAPNTTGDDVAVSPHAHRRCKHGSPRTRKRSKKADPGSDATEPEISDAVPSPTSSTYNGKTQLSPDPATMSANYASKEGTGHHNGESNRRGRKEAGGKKLPKSHMNTADEGLRPGTQGILKSPEEGFKVSLPSNKAVQQPPTESSVKVASPALKMHNEPSGARCTLVIQEDASTSKEARAPLHLMYS
ncbi:uncharacterized protein LOC142803578 [Rhipicephalus microplus]|uniref:uncharacterized protein LOC142803578 n=1 Tax=Rhipicephalus microplus TaxID=6941 RepID=UPI003F6A735E